MFSIRESFAAKLLTGLVGTIGVLLVVAYGVVRSETERQVAVVSEQAVRSAERLFQGTEDLRRQQADRVVRILTEGRRTVAALEEAIDAGDQSYFAGQVAYQLDLADLQEMVVSFTDAAGRPVLTLHGDEPMHETDHLGIGAVAMELLQDTAYEVRSYRVLEGQLFGITTRVIALAGRPIGTITFGVPVTNQDVSQIGELLGVEVCVVVADSCVAGSPGGLSEALASAAGGPGGMTSSADGAQWSVSSRPLLESDPERGWRVVAVPLDEVLAPFDRIRRALLFAGAAALVVALLVGTALSRGLSRPIRALVAATGRVARGDFDTEVSVQSHDEVGTLAEAFNEMTRGLRLKEQYRSVLDKVVSKDVAEQLLEGGVELGGENRKVAVLFADIRGFTPITEGMEPQAVIGFLNDCMQRLSDAVEAEGGVVDKYVGDELMAVFGAPAAQPDRALRAVRAAVRMQRAVDAWNQEREPKGLSPIGIGVGVNAGVAVAGNMGSRDRLNYTVLGDMVNLAARLCSSAEPGQVLVTRRVLNEVGGDVHYEGLGERVMRGMAAEVEVFQVTGVEELGTGNAPARSPRSPVLTVLLAAAAMALPGSLAAQDGAFPTLADAGLGYSSASGSVQLAVSGQLDLEGFWMSNPRAGLVLTDGASTLMAHRLRVFTDIFLGDRVYGHVELRSDRGDAPTDGDVDARVEQAFLRVANLSGSLSLQLGRFASPFGTYAARHLTEVDPFLRPPLPYDYRTVQCPTIAPSSASRFLQWKHEPETFRYPLNGAPPIWSVPYQWGAMVAGTAGPVSYRLAAMNSAPSSAPDAWGWDAERMKHPSVVAGVGVALSPELRVDASYNQGPWLDRIQRGDLSMDQYRFDYDQVLTSVAMTLARGPLMVRAEGIYDRWEVPNMPDDPVDWGYSVEVQSDLAAGVFVAGRVSGLDFSFVDDGLGAASSLSGGGTEWDHDVTRLEASVGYRVARNAGILASWYTQVQTEAADSDADLLGVRLWWAF